MLSNSSRHLLKVPARRPSSLTPSPIEPSWIIEGNPVAQAVSSFKSAGPGFHRGLAMQ